MERDFDGSASPEWTVKLIKKITKQAIKLFHGYIQSSNIKTNLKQYLNKFLMILFVIII